MYIAIVGGNEAYLNFGQFTQFQWHEKRTTRLNSCHVIQVLQTIHRKTRAANRHQQQLPHQSMENYFIENIL